MRHAAVEEWGMRNGGWEVAKGLTPISHHPLPIPEMAQS